MEVLFIFLCGFKLFSFYFQSPQLQDDENINILTKQGHFRLVAEALVYKILLSPPHAGGSHSPTIFYLDDM